MYISLEEDDNALLQILSVTFSIIVHKFSLYYGIWRTVGRKRNIRHLSYFYDGRWRNYPQLLERRELFDRKIRCRTSFKKYFKK